MFILPNKTGVKQIAPSFQLYVYTVGGAVDPGAIGTFEADHNKQRRRTCKWNLANHSSSFAIFSRGTPTFCVLKYYPTSQFKASIRVSLPESGSFMTSSS